MDGVTTTEDSFTKRKNGAAAQDTSDQEKTGTCFIKTLHSKQVVSPSQRNIPVYVYLLHFRQHLFLT